ncbi:MAG: hypothetical protein M3018_11305, partial [Actinomycetota bacterium]|nr:hypothetical protein [Actinomycetota bacterium]
MTARSRFTCLLALFTITGGTMFGVTSAFGRVDTHHAAATIAGSGQAGAGPGTSTGDGTGAGSPTGAPTGTGSGDVTHT